jgi:Mitochondrial carrier protein
MMFPSRVLRMHVMFLLLVVFAMMLCLCECRAPAVLRSQQVVAVTPNGPLQLFVSTIKEARRHLAAAAVARSVSIFAMYPVDTVKTRIQMGLADPLRLTGLYKGVAGSLIGQVPYG